MPPTPSAITATSYHREPLVVSLGILNGVRRFLVIRDVAGEDMERPSADTLPLAFLAHADAVFFRFDPMAVPEIRATLHELRNAFLRDSSQERASYQNDDGELLHKEVRSLLHKLNAGRLVLSPDNPHSGQTIPYRFFAVSAPGEAPRGQSVHPRGIDPSRCLDPAKWGLEPHRGNLSRESVHGSNKEPLQVNDLQGFLVG